MFVQNRKLYFKLNTLSSYLVRCVESNAQIVAKTPFIHYGSCFNLDRNYAQRVNKMGNKTSDKATPDVTNILTMIQCGHQIHFLFSAVLFFFYQHSWEDDKFSVYQRVALSAQKNLHEWPSGSDINLWNPSILTCFNWVNTLRPRQNGRHFADDTFNRIFLNENVRISFQISLKFDPKGPINNNPA